MQIVNLNICHFRCDTSAFVLSKSQKKVIKKFNRFLEDGRLFKRDNLLETQHDDTTVLETNFVKERPNIVLDNVMSSSTVDCVADSLAGGEPHNKPDKTSATGEGKSGEIIG